MVNIVYFSIGVDAVSEGLHSSLKKNVGSEMFLVHLFIF